MAINPKDLAKLSPQERIKKLKQLEENRKKEGREIEKLIKESMQELRTEQLATEITPEQKPVDISRLFEADGDMLEKAVNNEKSARMMGKADYHVIAQAYEDYSKLKRMMGYVAEGSLTEEHIKVVDRIGERLDKTRYESASEEIANILVASKMTLHKIRKYAGM